MEQVPITPVARKQPKISVNGATNDNDDEEPETPISPPAFRAKTTPSWPPSRSEEELAKVVAEEEAGVAASTEPSATSTSNDTAKGVEGTSTDVEGAPPVPAKEAPTPPPKTAESKPPLVVPPVSLPITPAETAKALASANRGFDYLFANEIGLARETFGGADTGVVEVSPFHLLGLGVCAFLEAALGMESGLMGEASRLLTASEAGARRAGAERGDGGGRFTPGTEYEILGADAVVLIGLTHALSESYMGYFQCMYALNAAHSKFTKLYKTVFPAGLEQYEARSASRAASRAASITSGPSSVSVASTGGGGIKSLFGRWGKRNSSSVSLTGEKVERERAPEGEVEEMIVAGTAFGFGLFNLVFSLLPKKVQSLVGLLGFKHDRALALRALAVRVAGRDVHGVFAGLVLMTFHGVVLLLSGYQADEARTLKTYKAIVDRIEARYPTGALWLLNRAKILRMSNDPQGAIAVLQRALEAPQTFVQADTLLVFELAWTLLAQRRHQEAADAFVKLTELNSWSHATYYFIAAGCYVSLGNRDKAQELFDAIPELLTRKKVGGKDLPTEVLIRKKLEFYKEKQKRRGGDPARFVDCISISPADGAFFWNTHQRIDDAVAEAHIAELAALTPPVALAVPSPYLPVPHPDQPSQDLDTPDERALRALLLGIMHRTLRLYAPARALLEAARGMQGVKVSTWIAGVALFELAVTDLKEADGGASAHKEKGKGPEMDKAAWARVLSGADSKLDGALGMAGKSDIDLSSRLDSRIALLRDEIAAKRAMVGL
ncbi:hypothetical protein B0H16DRAFT_1325584 [Mycena metata]|uniref:Mitochondrial outer membrane protein IML2 n=1 Tax=Mycena metata TaxID=1033252 RepID=A0AAD7MY48_9AGAR|nr:hypothetical protein B0H16DRAFT_1325584 [Mycena metata]